MRFHILQGLAHLPTTNYYLLLPDVVVFENLFIGGTFLIGFPNRSSLLQASGKKEL